MYAILKKFCKLAVAKPHIVLLLQRYFISQLANKKGIVSHSFCSDTLGGLATEDYADFGIPSKHILFNAKPEQQ